jgi:uncharacterized membrane protein
MAIRQQCLDLVDTCICTYFFWAQHLLAWFGIIKIETEWIVDAKISKLLRGLRVIKIVGDGAMMKIFTHENTVDFN